MLGDDIIQRLRDEHREFADKNKQAAKSEYDEYGKTELRAEITGHNVMLFTATKIIREMMETTDAR